MRTIRNKKNNNSKSTLVFLLNSFFEKVYDAVAASAIGSFFMSHSSSERAYERSLLSAVFEHTSPEGKFQLSPNSDKLGKCPTRGLFKRIVRSILGADLFSFAVFSVLTAVSVFSAYILNGYLHNDLDIARIFSGLLLIVIFSIPVVLVGVIGKEKSFGDMLSESSLMSFLLCKVIGISDEYLYEYKRKGVRNTFSAVICALLIGVAAYFIEPLYIFLFLLILILSAAVLTISETGVMLVILFLPFADLFPTAGAILIYLMLISEISLVIKLIRYKRMLYFRVTDLFALLFAVVTLIGGISLKGTINSLSYTFALFVVIMFYFPIKSLISDQSWIRRCFSLGVVMGGVTALLSLGSGVMGTIAPDAYLSVFGNVFDGRLCFPFSTPTDLGIYLSVMVLLCVGIMYQYETESFKRRAVVLLISVFMSVCVIMTFSLVAIMSLAVGLLVFFILRTHKTLTVLLLAAFPIAFILPFVMPTVVDLLGYAPSAVWTVNSVDAARRHEVWESVGGIISENWLFGVGLADFEAYYLNYSIANGIAPSENCGSLYLDIIVRLGAVGFLPFVIMIFLHIRNGLGFINKSDDSRLALKMKALLSVVVAILIAASICSVWHDIRIMSLFWIILSLSCCVSEVGYRTSENEKKQFVADEDEVYMRLYM